MFNIPMLPLGVFIAQGAVSEIFGSTNRLKCKMIKTVQSSLCLRLNAEGKPPTLSQADYQFKDVISLCMEDSQYFIKTYLIRCRTRARFRHFMFQVT